MGVTGLCRDPAGWWRAGCSRLVWRRLPNAPPRLPPDLWEEEDLALPVSCVDVMSFVFLNPIRTLCQVSLAGYRGGCFFTQVRCRCTKRKCESKSKSESNRGESGRVVTSPNDKSSRLSYIVRYFMSVWREDGLLFLHMSILYFCEKMGYCFYTWLGIL